MIDSIYKTAQAILNKEQLGYLKPMDFNLFIRNAQRKVYDKYFTDLKSNVRKMNWMLDGKDFANLSEHTRQLLEYFSFQVNISKTTDFDLPTDLEFVEDILNVAAIGTVTLNTGTSGSVSGIIVNGVEIMSGAEAFDTDLPTTATNVAANITSNTSSPNYTAVAVGSMIMIISVTLGASVNGFVVVSTTTTITTTDVNMAGGNARIEKVHYSDYLDLQFNTYAPPSICSPICAKVGTVLKISPIPVTTISLHYLRKPLTPNWTYVEFQSKPMFDETANDYQDVDMPNSAYDQLVSLVVEMASISLRELSVTQAANAEQVQDLQAENKQ